MTSSKRGLVSSAVQSRIPLFRFPLLGVALLGIVLVAAACAPAPNPVHYRGIPTIDGLHPNRDSSAPDLSDDGRYVTFTSGASNVVAGDGNDSHDVFVWDLSTDEVRRPVGIGGAEPNGHSGPSAISADGGTVAFSSAASNLVVGDTNGVADVFVWHTSTDDVVAQPAGVDGEPPNGASHTRSISAGGRFVAFASYASNLVAGDTNDDMDVFLWDLETGAVLRQPSGVGGAQPDRASTTPMVSADGRTVAFESRATNLVVGDDNGVADVFVWDVDSGTVVRPPGLGGAAPDGTTFQPAISDDGRSLAFASSATNLVADDVGDNADVFLWDRVTDTVRRQPNGVDGLQQAAPHWNPSVSPTGRTVVFTSWATNLTPGVPGAGSMYLWDTQMESLRRLPNGVDGRQPDGWSTGSASSADGHVVAFTSAANNLTPNADGASQGLYKVVVWVR